MENINTKFCRISEKSDLIFSNLQEEFFKKGILKNKNRIEFLDFLADKIKENSEIFLQKDKEKDEEKENEKVPESGTKNEEEKNNLKIFLDSFEQENFLKQKTDYQVLTKNEREYFLKGEKEFEYFVTKDEKGRLKLPKNHYYDDNNFPCDSSGEKYILTPFGYYDFDTITFRRFISNPEEYPDYIFKERNPRFQKWYGQKIIRKNKNYDYEKDLMNFLNIDYVLYWQKKGLSLIMDRAWSFKWKI